MQIASSCEVYHDWIGAKSLFQNSMAEYYVAKSAALVLARPKAKKGAAHVGFDPCRVLDFFVGELKNELNPMLDEVQEGRKVAQRLVEQVLELGGVGLEGVVPGHDETFVFWAVLDHGCVGLISTATPNHSTRAVTQPVKRTARILALR